MADPPSGGALGCAGPPGRGGGKGRGRGEGGESRLRPPPRPGSPRRASASPPPGTVPHERPARSRGKVSRGESTGSVSPTSSEVECQGLGWRMGDPCGEGRREGCRSWFPRRLRAGPPRARPRKGGANSWPSAGRGGWQFWSHARTFLGWPVREPKGVARGKITPFPPLIHTRTCTEVTFSSLLF